MKPLSPRQQRFVQEYIKDLNGKQAAIRAGYAKKSAEVQASQLLRFPKVKAAVDQALAELKDADVADAREVLVSLTRIGRADIRKVFTEDGALKRPGDIDDGTAFALQGVDTLERKQSIRKLKDPDEGEDQLTTEVELVRKVRMHDKIKALELLGKYHKLFVDRIERESVVVILQSAYLSERMSAPVIEHKDA